ncbi:MAG: kelch repeat-containing protein [Dehalococcoidia bacterium]|nr:kelch repeat-containing protein [Dehalococcoidia bacterium]
MAVSRAPKSRIFALFLLLMALVVACGGDGGPASMEEGRGEHTTTLLPDSRLLVTGGRGSRPLTSAEMYDPSTDIWSPAGSMAQARYRHTETTLEDGRILIVGGDGLAGRKPLASAELYDPATNTWTSAGSMTYPHGLGHTTTLLQNGKILVAGGSSVINDSNRITAFAELYDPSANTWSLTGDMTEAREYHKAVLLKDGRVLVMGGASTELYDPSTGTWSQAGEYAKEHVLDFAAVPLDDGRVLVSGGGQAKSYGRVPSFSHSDIYDPSKGEWSPASEMTGKQREHSLTLLKDGRVLLLALKSAELYDPIEDMWSLAGEMSQNRAHTHTATVLEDGTVLIVGGSRITRDIYGGITDREGMTSVELYDPAVGWETR